MSIIISIAEGRLPRSVVSNLQHCDIVLSQFYHQSRYYDHFFEHLRKLWTPFALAYRDRLISTTVAVWQLIS